METMNEGQDQLYYWGILVTQIIGSYSIFKTFLFEGLGVLSQVSYLEGVLHKFPRWIQN